MLGNAADGGAGWEVALVGVEADTDVTGGHGIRVGLEAPLSETADLVIVPGGGRNDRRPHGALSELAAAGALVQPEARVVDDVDIVTYGAPASGRW